MQAGTIINIETGCQQVNGKFQFDSPFHGLLGHSVGAPIDFCKHPAVRFFQAN